jgi:L,D-transpeptidase ErfK/SrfK
MPLVFKSALFLLSIAGCSVLLPTMDAWAWQPRLMEEARLVNKKPTVIGFNRDYILGKGENLVHLAYRSGIGYTNLVCANPEIDPWMPSAGEHITLPTAAIIPQPLEPGITINLAELRLYLIWEQEGQKYVRIYPIGIGREGRDTPLGTYRVANRAENPSWTPPPSIRAQMPELPPVVPPGGDNPLGSHWIGLSAHNLGIHGTNKPHGVGRRISSGCIRLYPRDIEDLYHRVTVGLPVRIINNPIKLGIKDGHLYLEVHSLEGIEKEAAFRRVWDQVETVGVEQAIDRGAVQEALQRADGLPVRVSVPREIAGTKAPRQEAWSKLSRGGATKERGKRAIINE